MKDLLEKDLKINDVVAHVTVNKNGRIVVNVGTVVGFNNKGAQLITKQGSINVKNVIKVNKQNSLVDFFKKIF